MKNKILPSFFIIAAFTFVFAKSLPVNAEPAIGAYVHKSASRYVPYLFASVEVDYDWDFYYSERIIYSKGYSKTSGAFIAADTYCYSQTDKEHKYKTVVYRGITFGASVGSNVSGNAGGNLNWVSDEFTYTLSYLGHSH